MAPTIKETCPSAETRYSIRNSGTPAKMIVLGASSLAVALVRVGKLTGYHVTVCDAQATFATRERFPDANELVVRGRTGISMKSRSIGVP